MIFRANENAKDLLNPFFLTLEPPNYTKETRTIQKEFVFSTCHKSELSKSDMMKMMKKMRVGKPSIFSPSILGDLEYGIDILKI